MDVRINAACNVLPGRLSRVDRYLQLTSTCREARMPSLRRDNDGMDMIFEYNEKAVQLSEEGDMYSTMVLGALKRKMAIALLSNRRSWKFINPESVSDEGSLDECKQGTTYCSATVLDMQSENGNKPSRLCNTEWRQILTPDYKNALEGSYQGQGPVHSALGLDPGPSTSECRKALQWVKSPLVDIEAFCTAQRRGLAPLRCYGGALKSKGKQQLKVTKGFVLDTMEPSPIELTTEHWATRKIVPLLGGQEYVKVNHSTVNVPFVTSRWRLSQHGYNSFRIFSWGDDLMGTHDSECLHEVGINDTPGNRRVKSELTPDRAGGPIACDLSHLN
eukprot:1351213-Amphidinium_carterae.1